MKTAVVAGGAAGIVNGLFGGGGGMILLPALRHGTLPERRLYPTCVGVMFPVCAVSALVYAFRDGGEFLPAAAPYLFGGAAGGWIGGRLYGKIPLSCLRRLFAGFLLYAGIRYLLW